MDLISDQARQPFSRKERCMCGTTLPNISAWTQLQVHPDDVPTVGFGGSGGGFRAMIGCLGYSEEMKRTGLWDLLTYFAGVSGSCWALAAYYTFGEASMAKIIEHCKKTLSPYHPLSAEAIRTVLTVPDGLYVTLGPLVEKHRSGLHIVAMDLYSVFTTGHLFLHDEPSHPSLEQGATGDHCDERGRRTPS